ncbi:MAG: N-acetylglucosamine-6-phosphate deacetylase [Streptococcaceae bacterium]|jgi:N-acetylglucosamine-6-phosphate deacetylase|nr:N-acetylglucosamine-6-phosphate deacetylase [Streptococcaceae bacterium]
MSYFIKADKFFYPYETKRGGYLEIIEGKFGNWASQAPENAEILDYSGYNIAPGLVDTHIHGFHDFDVMDDDIRGLLTTMSEGLLSVGVTSFFPSTLTGDHETLRHICEEIGNHYQEAKGAKIQGIFFEGPYFTEKHKGAQNPNYMTDPSVAEFHEWNAAAKGMLKKIGLAPERKGVAEFIRTISSEGVAIALGHSNASYEQAVRGVEAGANIWVHTYNGMSALNHREPGMVGAAFDTPNTYTELICDGHHVHPAACKALINAKGADHVVLVTDSMRAAGMPEGGSYVLGEFPVVVKDGAVRLVSDGNLAASLLTLNQAVKNVVDWGIVTPEEAVMMATLTAAISAKVDNVCGQIKYSHAADFIVLKPDMTLSATYLDGEKRFEA